MAFFWKLLKIQILLSNFFKVFVHQYCKLYFVVKEIIPTVSFSTIKVLSSPLILNHLGKSINFYSAHYTSKPCSFLHYHTSRQCFTILPEFNYAAQSLTELYSKFLSRPFQKSVKTAEIYPPEERDFRPRGGSGQAWFYVTSSFKLS